jgi:AcrR family transcriptional regulator
VSTPNKREQIMRAAEKLFTSRRLHEITLDEVADVAGVGKGTIYRYFRDKDDLFFQTATAGFDELCEVVTAAAPPGLTFQGRLHAACERIAEFFARRLQLFQMMQAEENRMLFFHGELRERWLDHRRHLVAAVTEIIRSGVREGHLRGDMPADLLANILLGLLRTQARDLHELSDRGGARSDGEGEGWGGSAPRIVADLFCHGAGAAGFRPAANGSAP